MKRVPIIAAVAVVAAVIPAAGSVAAAASHPATATYHSVRGSAHRLARASSLTKFHVVREALTGRQLRRLNRFRSPAGADPAAMVRHVRAQKVSAAYRLRGADRGPGGRLSGPRGADPGGRPPASPRGAEDGAFVLHNFNGLSNSDVFKIFGQLEPVTPPDQGLCVGHDVTLPGDPKAVFEPVNVEIRETTPDGTLLRPDIGGPTFYQDPFNDGDVRCLYDPSTQTFFFTAIGFP